MKWSGRIARLLPAVAFGLVACQDQIAGPSEESISTPPEIRLDTTGDDPVCIPPPDNLVSWWPGETDASDVQGGNDGVLRNGVTAGAPGLVGGAFEFDGVDDFVEVAPAANLDITGAITLIAWVNVLDFGTVGSGSNPHPSVIGKGNVGNFEESYALFVNPDQTASILVNTTGSSSGRRILGGRATFGFVSRYKKGATTPSGGTQFRFHSAEMVFESTSYQWLVVAGARAQFKGEGNLNEAGGYGFLLSAIDGQVSGGGGSDKFRIKIWDAATGEIVYDNQLGDEDDADPTTIIEGGQIKIHS